ncbi:hypothetical protein ACHAXT_000369 [Thalassiosira profunda]
MHCFFRGHDDFPNLIANEGANGDDDIGGSLAPTECWDGRDASPASNVVTSSFGDMVSGVDGIAADAVSPGSASIDRWNECCSFFRPNDEGPSCFDGNNRYLCCDVAEGSDNHLILPALREPSVDIRLQLNGGQAQEVIRIEQEGSLRMFDVAGVLWPAGYLLGMCLADPISCGLPEVMDAVDDSLQRSGRPLAIELGAGAGFPSIAFAKNIIHRNSNTENSTSVCEEGDKTPVIVATDVSNASLTLIASNANMNGVGNLVAEMEANHTNATSLSKLSQRAAEEDKGGFDIVIGSSLQSLFDGTSQQSAALWQSLDALLSTNPNAVAILSHVRTGDEKIALPPEPGRIFECVRRLSGDRFGMKTRDGNTSDFEVVLLKRRHT